MKTLKRKPYILRKAIITRYSGEKFEVGFDSPEIQNKPLRIMEDIVLDTIIKIIDPAKQKQDPLCRAELVVSFI